MIQARLILPFDWRMFEVTHHLVDPVNILSHGDQGHLLRSRTPLAAEDLVVFFNYLVILLDLVPHRFFQLLAFVSAMGRIDLVHDPLVALD